MKKLNVHKSIHDMAGSLDCWQDGLSVELIQTLDTV